MKAEFDTSDMKRFIGSLDTVPVRLDRAGRDLVKDTTRDLRDAWRSNARRTAGAHGPHYPNAITDEVHGLNGIIGPESGMPQGGMSFEYGSRNQPPHLDGNRAADEVLPRFSRRAEILLSDVFRGL